ncbi:hypothetical protein ONS95_012313 [Cadophora gregata]|uniref:uncharacterized protein n=1 Tax=Cadophora gregata TaxID=51156 RepID=UPI0026DC7D9A|nr:uncharacterized protein ONS95_012313 [Cadophora gregata]KAK0118002.1 hypothetical protein ONS95_012313 [Cadophora gregata]KAK0123068.1 hypothetical protein ONS96_010076 [Cadophora gregata f. sp. sojae]
MSVQQKFGNKAINAFGPNMQQSGLTALINNNWPCWLVSDQLRVKPGLWDLANTLMYEGQIAMHPDSKSSEDSAVFKV